MRAAVLKASRFSRALDFTDISVEAQSPYSFSDTKCVRQVKAEKRRSTWVISSGLRSLTTKRAGEALKSPLSLEFQRLGFGRRNGLSSRTFRPPKARAEESALAGRRRFHNVPIMWTREAPERPEDRAQRQNEQKTVQPGQSDSHHRVFVAFGSNLGDRVGHIDRALLAMCQEGLLIRKISPIYETKPMYVTNQDCFLNGVCEVATPLKPLELLDVLQCVENDLGREKKIDKGPRNIDLDIVLYDNEQVSHHRLNVPHKLMLEREFVLRPLADLIPQDHLPQVHNTQTVSDCLGHVVAANPGARPYTVTALASSLPLVHPTDTARRTKLMAILNMTPDSFSDGLVHAAADLKGLERTIRKFIDSGASIIDIGGQSTRPNATHVSAREELERILPAIKLIRSMPEADHVAISVDTFYAKVAEEATAAGADIINDVTGGVADSRMLPLVAKLQKTIILMHMRGTPQTMTQLTDYPDGVIHGVGIELAKRVNAAKEAGIPPWRIVVDPGIGFAKTLAQNLELLRKFDELRDYPGLRNLPWLLGVSRKGFIGKITGVQQADQRTWGTAAAVTASIGAGADIVRVHDVAEMSQVVKMADAIYRVA